MNPLEMVKNQLRLLNRSILMFELGVRLKLRFWGQTLVEETLLAAVKKCPTAAILGTQQLRGQQYIPILMRFFRPNRSNILIFW